MPLLTRRGFTLVELLVSLVLLAIVAGGIYQVLTNQQRLYRSQTNRIDLQQNLRAAAAILPAEFRALDASDSDIVAMGPDSIVIRAMRKFGVMCVPPGLGGGVGNITIVVRDRPMMFGRDLPFKSNDSVLVFFEGRQTTRNDDMWLPAMISLQPQFGAQFCTGDPNGGSPGWSLTMNPQWLASTSYNYAGAITNGSPIRAFETVEYRLYQSADGNWYVGYHSLYPSAGMQPLIGPLSGSAGLEFDYYDSTGAVTTSRRKVASIAIHLRARTAQPVPSGGAGGPVAYKIDSVTTRVALRNNSRCGPCL